MYCVSYITELPGSIRLVLLLMVIIACSGMYVVENPTGTLLWQHERFSHFTNKMAWVFWLQLVVWTIFQVGAVNVRSVSLF